MDRNTVIGVALIFTILIGFSYFNKPSQEEIAAAKKTQDSIELVRVEKEKADYMAKKAEEAKSASISAVPNDSLSSEVDKARKEEFGIFASAAVGKEKFYSIENNLMKVTFSNKGGRIYSVELKNFKTFEQKPLILFEKAVKSARFHFVQFFVQLENLSFSPFQTVI